MLQTTHENDAQSSRAADSETETDETSFASSTKIKILQRKAQSVLIIGALGKTGLETIQQLGEVENSPLIYGMTRDLMTTSGDSMDLFMKYGETLIEGNPTTAADIHRALLISNADTIVVSVGNGRRQNNLIRTQSAQAIARVLQHQPFHGVRVIVVSWAGVAPKFRMGFGKLVEKSYQSVLMDHAGQERTFTSDERLRRRTTIVRPTKISTTNGTTIMKVGSKDSSPTTRTNRRDLAKWIVDEILHAEHIGSVINITSVISQPGNLEQPTLYRDAKRI